MGNYGAMTITLNSYGARLVPVMAGDGPQLYDIYIAGDWLGSRRTIRQCELVSRTQAGDVELASWAATPAGKGETR